MPHDVHVPFDLGVSGKADLVPAQKSLAAVQDDFGYAAYGMAVGDLAAELQQLGAGDGLTGMMAGAVAAAARHGGGASLGAFIADTLLAQRLGWAQVLRRMSRRLALRCAPSRRSCGPRGGDRGRTALVGEAMLASDAVGGMSDRALRRLFDRLVSLGAVRDLSGRPTFRIYGL